MAKLVLTDGTIKYYDTKGEAQYYKKQFKGSKVIETYRIFDTQGNLFQDDILVDADTPKNAIEAHINKKVIVDTSNTGRYVVQGHRATKVYNALV